MGTEAGEDVGEGVQMKTDIPWVAGVLDARASFSVTNRRGVEQPRLRIVTARLALVQTMCSMTGVTIRRDGGLYQKRVCADHCKEKHSHVMRQSTAWTADCTRATIILHSCLPFMHSARDEALALLDLGYPNYQPTKNGTAKMMAGLGWILPGGTDARVPASRRGELQGLVEAT